MKYALTRFNPIRALRRYLDSRAERAAYELLQQEDVLMAQRLKQHRLANRQRMCRTSMGTNAISHPDYRFNGRHSNDSSIWPHFREGYLETIRDCAEVARGDNKTACLHAARLSHQL